jgi:uncharacterized protein
MEAAQVLPRAVAVSSLDLPQGQQLMLHGCEDCACPVSSDAAVVGGSAVSADDMAGMTTWVRSREIVEIQLDRDRHAFFNPVGHGGVVVVNESARWIANCFVQPIAFGDARGRWHGDTGNFEEVFSRLVRLQMIHRSGEVQEPDFQTSTILTAWLHVTNACNLRCQYCYVSKTDEGMDESVGRAAVEAVFRSAVQHGFQAVKLKYAGGEASLNHRLMLTLHRYARALSAEYGLQLHATMLSNGVTLRPMLVDALKAEGIRIMISLDGLGPLHDTQRPFVNGKPSFRFVERTIDRLIDQGHAPHISITITSRNLAGLAAVVRFVLERGLTFSLNFFRDNDCAASFSDLKYEEQAMIAALLEAFAVIEELLPPWSVLGSILDRGQLLQPRQRSCGVGQDYMVVSHRGEIAKCHMEIERTLGDVYSPDPLRLIQQDTKTVQGLAVEEKEGCRDCTWRYWCSGGCAVATFRATGRYDIKSPNCNIYKAIYPEALKLEGLRLLKYAATHDHR